RYPDDTADRRPRTRGDGPRRRRPTGSGGRPSAPHTRGWSLVRHLRDVLVRVGPAHAGMVLDTCPLSTWCTSRPRACGDGPEINHGEIGEDGSAPRMRGWSQCMSWGQRVSPVGPAHAGMVRPPTATTTSTASRPRACGDGPWAT